MDNYSFFADRSVERHNKSDFTFLVSLIFLFGFGLFTQFVCTQGSAQRMFGDSFYFVKRQLICAAVGLVGFGLFSSLNIEKIRKMLPVIIGVTFILCLLTFVPFLSVEKNGARRWLKMPFNFSLQSSEVVKFALLLFLANFFDKQLSLSEGERNVFPAVAILITFVGMIFLQKDLSTGLFIFCVCFLMFYVCGLKIRWAFALALLAIPLLILFIVSEPYRLDRIIGFLRPEEGQLTINYQNIAAKRAISAGGFWGNGIGTGLVQSGRIPEVQADYIFAAWTEAMGFGGVLTYFVLLGIFGYRGFRIAFRSTNRFASFGTMGFVMMIILQSLLNIAVVCGGVPSTGIPLPFYSVGGSSIIVTFFMCGFIVNASRLEAENNRRELTESERIQFEFEEVTSLDGER